MIPKYRVYDKVKKSMNEVEAIVYTENKVYPFYSKVVRRYIPFEESVLMQSTGLFDKNGEEIFEGDVVYAYSEGARLIGVIEYFDNAYCIKDKNGIYNPLWVNAEHYEVISNIWENGELVEAINE